MQNERQLGDGWSQFQIAGRTPKLQLAVTDLVAATKGPALVAYVMDSDCAVLEGRSQNGNRWEGILNRKTCAGMAGSDEDVLAMYPLDRCVSGAVEWAREAGLTPSEQLVKQALEADETFAEDALNRLLVALGLAA